MTMVELTASDITGAAVSAMLEAYLPDKLSC